MAKYKFYVSTGYVGASREEIIEIPDAELEGKNSIEIDNYIYENYYKWWLEETTEMSFYQLDEEEED